MIAVSNESKKSSRSGADQEDPPRSTPKRYYLIQKFKAHDVILKAKRERFRMHWTDFCNVTSVHGVRYLVADDRPVFERLLWAAILATSLYFASVYVSALCSRWLKSPIEQTSVTKFGSVLDIPAPALTFCNNMKAAAGKKTVTELSLICGIDGVYSPNISAIDIEEMKEMAPPFNVSCQMNHYYPPDVSNTFSGCEKMFTSVISQHGVCYTFNMMDAKEVFMEGVIHHFSSHGRSSDWDPEEGYMKEDPIADGNGTNDPFFEGPYPKRAISMPTINISFESLFHGSFCSDDFPGVKVAVHGPHEMPVLGHRATTWILVNDESQKKEGCFNCLRSDFEYFIEIEPEHTWASQSLQLFKPHQRKCYFNGEKFLSYFKFYSKTNCENECLTNLTLEICNCVDFYMPHFESTRVCDLNDVSCILEAFDFWERRGKKGCNCYPSCNEMKYNTFIWGKNKSKELARKGSQQVMTAAFMTADYIYISTEKKQSQWTIVDLVSSCGGVFGLFCGMSLIGVIEFLYYGTIRIATNMWRRRRNKGRSQEDGISP